jgi:hypothetical protein
MLHSLRSVFKLVFALVCVGSCAGQSVASDTACSQRASTVLLSTLETEYCLIAKERAEGGEQREPIVTAIRQRISNLGSEPVEIMAYADIVLRFGPIVRDNSSRINKTVAFPDPDSDSASLRKQWELVYTTLQPGQFSEVTANVSDLLHASAQADVRYAITLNDGGTYRYLTEDRSKETHVRRLRDARTKLQSSKPITFQGVTLK